MYMNIHSHYAEHQTAFSHRTCINIRLCPNTSVCTVRIPARDLVARESFSLCRNVRHSFLSNIHQLLLSPP